MKRLITSITFTLTIILLYQFVDINLFTIDLPRRVRSELFKSFRHDPQLDLEVIIIDIEYIELDSMKAKLEVLESFGPKAIGVNLCNIRDTSKALDEYLNQSKNIVTCDCSTDSNKGTSRITSLKNEVTHFLTDKDAYFELQLSNNSNDAKTRGNNRERINFRAADIYYQLPLTEIENIDPDFVKDKTILVGFLYDSLITPMNHWYGRTGVSEGDMSDAQISANIISTINRNEFINEISPVLRVSIVLLAGLICTGLIRLVRTRRDAVNILLGLVILIILNGLTSYLIVFAFLRKYYVNLDEMTVVLIIAAIVSVYWNTKDKRAQAHNKVFVPAASDELK